MLEPGRRHARATLVDLLWPDLPETSGRQSLRQALYSLKTVGGGRLNPCLQVDPGWVLFEAPAQDSPVDIDVHRFLCAAHGETETHWLAAAAIHIAPLLDGVVAVPGPDHQAWLLAARDRLRALALQNLGRLAAAHMARSQWPQAARFAGAMCELDSTSEVASQYLLRIFAAQGLVQSVDAEWARLCAQLSQDLGVAPGAESQALYRALRQPTATPPEPRPAPAPQAVQAVQAAPTTSMPAVAREAEAMVWAGQAAERVFAFDQAADLYDRALRVMACDSAASAPLVDMLLRREAMLERLGRRAEQSALIDQAMAIAQGLGDPARVATVCLRRASVATYRRRHDDAQAAAELALQTFRELGDAPGQAEALRELGFVHWHAEQHAQALARTREALELHRHIGDVTGEATALHNLAEIHRGLGSPGQASRLFEQAMQLHWAARNPVGEIMSLFGWAQALRQSGDLDGCKRKLEAALKLSELSGERVMHSRVLHALSTHSAVQGALVVAVDLMRRAIAVDRSIGYAHALGHNLIDLSNLHLLKGEGVQARVAMLEALVWFGFNEDHGALDKTRARLDQLEQNGPGSLLATGLRAGVKSHLSLGEGKVYCEFESPLACLPQPGA